MGIHMSIPVQLNRLQETRELGPKTLKMETSFATTAYLEAKDKQAVIWHRCSTLQHWTWEDLLPLNTAKSPIQTPNKLT